MATSDPTPPPPAVELITTIEQLDALLAWSVVIPTGYKADDDPGFGPDAWQKWGDGPTRWSSAGYVDAHSAAELLALYSDRLMVVWRPPGAASAR